MWTALLVGSLAERALNSAVEIARTLSKLQPYELRAPLDANPDPSLATGASGVASCLEYLAESGVFPDGRAKAREFFGFAADVMSSERLNPSLLDGFTGIGWVARRLVRGLHEFHETDVLTDVDSELLAVLVRSPWKMDYDLVSGLAGLGLYALGRLPRTAARKALSRIVDHLAGISEVSGPGITWHTRPELLTDLQRAVFPEGHYNLGLAHGVPGVIGLLGQICSSGTGECEEKARRLLSGAVAWMLGNKQEGSARFRHCAGPGVLRREIRSAWCYGDPGIAAALLVAARGAKEKAWEQEAIELARHAAARPFEEAGVIDPGLCHGAAGLAHIFNRFYQETGDPTFGRAATFWFEKTLDMRRPGMGLAGYNSAVKLYGELSYLKDPSFLTGAAGIAMALTAAATEAEPNWDQVLLLSPVRRSQQ